MRETRKYGTPRVAYVCPLPSRNAWVDKKEHQISPPTVFLWTIVSSHDPLLCCVTVVGDEVARVVGALLLESAVGLGGVGGGTALCGRCLPLSTVEPIALHARTHRRTHRKHSPSGPVGWQWRNFLPCYLIFAAILLVLRHAVYVDYLYCSWIFLYYFSFFCNSQCTLFVTNPADSLPHQ